MVLQEFQFKSQYPLWYFLCVLPCVKKQLRSAGSVQVTQVLSHQWYILTRMLFFSCNLFISWALHLRPSSSATFIGYGSWCSPFSRNGRVQESHGSRK